MKRLPNVPAICSGLGLSLCILTFSSNAWAGSFAFNWTLNNNWKMNGSFSTDATSGVIDESDLTALSFSAFNNEVLFGTSTFTTFPSEFNFNFDLDLITFITGGNSPTSTGQDWNCFDETALGFCSGGGRTGLTNTNAYTPIWLESAIETSDVGGSFSVTPETSTNVPTPATLPGVIGMGIAVLRKRKQEAEKVVL